MIEDVASEFWVYPLHWGDTLSNQDWVPLHVSRLLNSRFVAYSSSTERGRAALGTAFILWTASYHQDPAGTLPDDDVELAQLAKYGADVEAWKLMRADALTGWQPCEVEGEGGHGKRLGHRVIAGNCEDMFRRKRGRDASREERNFAVQRTRVKKKLMEIGQTRIAENDGAVLAIAQWLAKFNLFISETNLRNAIEAAIGGPRAVK